MDIRRVKELRRVHELSLQQAVRIVKGEAILKDIADARSVDDLRQVLFVLVSDQYPYAPDDKRSILGEIMRHTTCDR